MLNNTNNKQQLQVTYSLQVMLSQLSWSGLGRIFRNKEPLGLYVEKREKQRFFSKGGISAQGEEFWDHDILKMKKETEFEVLAIKGYAGLLAYYHKASYPSNSR